ncbi:hypothetical protein [Bradyrhizobium japonicum]|uniref:hypothetical protein n=1 Tax=Bradyrhizobium japonicum TaxID=375 RepID=UPI001B89E863|nr:hypothetical protein [Bradyrhizobium japonicum]MBR0969487.1 hypothetical protein [Bradyrhizobium japonicum]
MKYPKLTASKNWPNREQFAARLRILEGEEPLRREKNADSTIQVSRGLFACPHCSETFLHRIWRFNGWEWWEDLRHVVTEHGMKVDAEFEKFIAKEIKWSAQKKVKLERPPGR